MPPPLPSSRSARSPAAEAAGRLLGADVRRGQDGGAQRGEHRVHDALVRCASTRHHPSGGVPPSSSQWCAPSPCRCAGYSMFTQVIMPASDPSPCPCGVTPPPPPPHPCDWRLDVHARTQLKSGFDTVLIDEAAQAIEVSTLIPLKYARRLGPARPVGGCARPITAVCPPFTLPLPLPAQVRVPAAHPGGRPQPAARDGLLGARRRAQLRAVALPAAAGDDAPPSPAPLRVPPPLPTSSRSSSGCR